MLLKAKTHASSCGKKKRKLKLKKKHSCTECQQTFNKKCALNKHFSDSHQNSGYKCSTCFVSYKNRKTYTLHLKTHDSEFLNKFRCDLCKYKTRDNWLLKRHQRFKHTTYLSVPNNTAIIKPTAATANAAEGIVESDYDELNEVEDVGADGSGQDEFEDVTEIQRVCVDPVKDLEIEEVQSVDIGEEMDKGVMDDGESDVEEMDVEERDEENQDESAQKQMDTKTSQKIANENVSPNILAKKRPLCRWEEIKLSIIAERDQKMAEAGILQDLMEAKKNVEEDRRKTNHRKRNDYKITTNTCNEMRRSERVKFKEMTEESVREIETETEAKESK